MWRNNTISDTDKRSNLFIKRFVSILFSFIIIGSVNLHYLNAQDPENKKTDYPALYDKGAYREALKTITEKLNSYYKLTNDNRGFPDDYVFTDKDEYKKNIAEIFKNRKILRIR